ncbi:rod shape-determining protein MreD [Shewanella sp. 10N.286.52.C2]|uniref:rod shape-determining protein MreD n=1 Tax=unclassified Shewanella TaxID=196818 RepID=UPI000C844396|nr:MULTISPECIES: rod shape-determining protein MreD [unclassified Shewanella]MDO6678638.1 rod shape-determining protein MreD [Shewanella sp. 4_MG-2023]MDO6775474.1 rod shape-determining protein MreD [Shewanella sp. 3_MG-2023]PMG31852.1 rod shape-determining protein MreD [Shewanella sp. 10N.286.52.C2]PMH98167.1 rod shape-determining protein MreD [Shewanella sp. 10N.286.48.A6]
MSAHIANGRMVVLITIFVSMMFQIMPLPPIVEAWRPDWLLMVMIYWAMALPHRYSVLTAWVVGVLLDVLLGATLGVRSLAFSIVIYLIVIQSQRLRNFTRWQQSILVALFVCLYHFIIYWVEFVINGVGFDWSMFLPAISSIFMWWWFFWVLRNIRRRYKVR